MPKKNRVSILVSALCALVLFLPGIGMADDNDDGRGPFRPEGTWYGTNSYGQTVLCETAPLKQPGHWSTVCRTADYPGVDAIAATTDYSGELVRVGHGVYEITQMAYMVGGSTGPSGWPLPYGTIAYQGTVTRTEDGDLSCEFHTVMFYPALPIGCGDDPAIDCEAYQDPWDPVYGIPYPPVTNLWRRMPTSPPLM